MTTFHTKSFQDFLTGLLPTGLLKNVLLQCNGPNPQTKDVLDQLGQIIQSAKSI